MPGSLSPTVTPRCSAERSHRTTASKTRKKYLVMKNCLPEVSKLLSRSVAWVWLLLSFLLIPGTQAQQVTRVGNLLTIAPSGSALANIPAEANGAIGVAATFRTSFALMPDGKVVAWGQDEYGLVTDAKYVRTARKIVAGNRTVVALLENGTLYAWGSGEYGILRQAIAIENAVDVYAAGWGAGVLKANGDAVVWGNFPNSPFTFSKVKKLEMTEVYGVPIAVVYGTDGSIQFYSNDNRNGEISYYQPNDLSRTISVSGYRYSQMIALQSDSSVMNWAIRDRGTPMDGISTKVEINRVIPSIDFIMGAALGFLKNSGEVDSIGVLPEGGGYSVSEVLSAYSRTQGSSIRFTDFRMGGPQFIGLLADGVSGPIIGEFGAKLIVEEGQKVLLGPSVLLGDSFQWSKNGNPMLGPVSPQTGRLLSLESVSLDDAGIYFNKVTGNGGTVDSAPIELIVRKAGAPGVEIDGESVAYKDSESPITVRRAGSARVTLSTSSSGNDKLYYTLDGSTPSWLTSELYSSPFQITETTRLRVVAYTDDKYEVPVYSGEVTVSIEPAFAVTVNQSVGGRVTVDPMRTGYFSGESVTIKAYPDVGNRFVGWKSGVGSGPVVTVPVSANLTYEAIFEPIPSYPIVGVESLTSGFRVRTAKLKSPKFIASLSDAETILNTSPDALAQNETATFAEIDFKNPSGDGWPNNRSVMPASKWEDNSVVEVSGYVEIKSPSVYTFWAKAHGAYSFSVGDKSSSTSSEGGEGELFCRFDKPGFYKLRLVCWDNNGNKKVIIRAKKGFSFDSGWWDDNSGARNLGTSDPGFPKVFTDLGYEVAGVGRVEATPSGNLYYGGESVELKAVPASADWEFMGWKGDVSGNSTTIRVVADRAIKAMPMFGRRLTLSKVVAPGSDGAITTIPEGPLYAYGSSVTLKAIPSQSPSSYFTRWSPNNKYGNFNFTSVQIDRFTPAITAFFSPVAGTSDLVLNLTSQGNGRVVATPSVANRGNLYKTGETVRLVAQPSEDSIFQNWIVNGADVQGATLDLTMTASMNVVAVFQEGLHVAVADSANGKVQVVPQKAGYKAGEVVQVIAVPANGYLLDRWTDLNSRETVRSITLSGDPGYTLTVGASFVAGVQINTTVNGRGSITTVPAGPLYYPGTSVVLSPNPAYGSKFVGWSGAVQGVGDQTLTLDTTKSVQASFQNEANVPVFGSLVHWGRQDWDLAKVPAGSDFIQVSAGVNHVVALRVDGTVAAWGWANGGENVTTVPAGLTGVRQVSGGNSYSLALKQDGTLVHWGGNRGGNMPVEASQIRDAIAVVSGSSGAVVLKANGTVVGIGNANSIQNKGWKDIVQISGNPNQDHFYGLTAQGKVLAYAPNDNNWMGKLDVPRDLSDVIQVASSEQAVFALKADGTLVGWGGGGYPWGLQSQVNGLTGIQRIEAGLYHFLAINQSGTVTAYGDYWAAVPIAAINPSQLTASQNFTVAIVPVAGLAPEILGSELSSTQLEVGDELTLGLGIEGRSVSQWQWQKATESGWIDLTGQTSRRLRIASVITADAGRYRVIASNNNGSDVGPESTVVVVPSGTPLISINGSSIAGLPSDTVKVRVGNSASIRVSSRMVGGQLRYSVGGAPLSFQSPTLGNAEVVELGLGSHKFRAGVAGTTDSVMVQSLTVDLEVVPTYAISTSVGQGEGSITIIPSKPKYLKDEVVTLKATPAPGFEFAGWDGVSGTGAEISVTMNQAFSPLAKFTVRPSYRITGVDAPSLSGWKVVRVVDSSAKPVTISDLSTALDALSKTSSEVQQFSETVPTISYRGRSPGDWYEANRVFPGGSQANDSAQPKFALRATGFVNIPTPGTHSFGAVFSGPFRLRVGDNEWNSGWEAGQDGRMTEMKFGRAGLYPIELIHWDVSTDYSQIIIFSKPGTSTSYGNNIGQFVSEGARLVGDVDRGGLRVWTELPNLNVAGVGAVTGSTGYSVFAGESVTLKAEPASGWTFVRWEGDVSGSSPTITVTPTSDLRVKPVYTTPLQLSVIGDATGAVHGRLDAVPNQASYEYGALVRVDATSDAGYGFEVFGGNVTALQGKTFAPAAFRVEKASPTVTARFKELAAESLISVSVNPVEGGYVQVLPAKNVFKAGDTVTLTAVPAEGYLLNAWSGAKVGH